MPEKDESKYNAPRAVRLADAASARGTCNSGSYPGESCYNGSNDVSCNTGTGAQAYCVNNGSNAAGCDQGDSPAVKGCEAGLGVHAL
ncbi:hypothetical protein JXD38_08340 [candidate division WOR-3 bacterium]|nr:hypothetical protein [candidate division WOR-3 bacterium]